MAADIDQRAQVGFRGPSSIPTGEKQTVIPFWQNKNPSHYVNQLQFNMHTPYSINSLASNFTKPRPLVIEKVPVASRSVSEVPVVSRIHDKPLPSSPASSISSNRLHFAVQLAKMDAKKIKEHKEMEGHYEQDQEVSPNRVAQNRRTGKDTQVYGVRKLQDKKQPRNQNDKLFQHKLQNKSKKDKELGKRTLHGHHVYPVLDSYLEKDDTTSDDRQTREIQRLEKQMHKYLEKLDELIHKGQEVIQKKDRRLRSNKVKDDVSHLSDDDTDPRQFKRAEEQATRSARVLYMIERQIRELDDELRKKGKNIRQGKKSQTLGRLAAAQRATVRALQMLINSAPLQPKGSHHYPSMYQELTSLIQQLSLLSIQLESDNGAMSAHKRPQNEDHEDMLNKPYPDRIIGDKKEDRSGGTRIYRQSAFNHESAKYMHGPPLKNTSFVTEIHPDDSTLTVDPTPERSATLKAGLEALLRAKQMEQKTTNIVPPTAVSTKKKAVLLPSSLQAKRRKANLAVQKSVKLPVETSHFTKETTASRLKKVEKPKIPARIKEDENGDHVSTETTKYVGTSPRIAHKTLVGFDDELQEKEIRRQVWLEDEANRRLREVMEIPKHLVSEAEEAIKMKLKPLLDQAQIVVDSSKTKPIQERFVDLASKVTMKESEALSEMILDDLLIDTVEEFQRLDDSDTEEIQVLQDSSTLENILQRLEQFEKEEESIRRHLTHVSYADPGDTNLRYNEETESLGIKTRSIEEGTREPHPIVIESTTVTNREPQLENKTRQLPRFNSTKDGRGYSSVQHTRPNLSSKHERGIYPKTSTLPVRNSRTVEEPPFSLSLPSKIRENIFSYRQKYSDYLEETNSRRNGSFDPWKLVERLSDDIFDELVREVADEFCGACDDVTDLIFKSEFMKE